MSCKVHYDKSSNRRFRELTSLNLSTRGPYCVVCHQGLLLFRKDAHIPVQKIRLKGLTRQWQNLRARGTKRYMYSPHKGQKML